MSGAGYMRPPMAHQFPKGRSGNARGRPRVPDDLSAAFARVLRRTMSVGGQRVPISEALLLKLRKHALAGDRRAIRFQQTLLSEIAEARAQDGGDEPTLDQKKRALLDRLHAEGRSLLSPKPAGAAGPAAGEGAALADLGADAVEDPTHGR